jgi:hypothetical protein
MKPFVEVFFFLLFLILLIRTLKKRISWKKTLFVSLSMLLVFFLLSQKSNLSSADFRESTSLLDSEEKSVEYEIEEPSQPAAAVLPIAKEEPSQPAAAVLPIAKEEPSQPAAAVLPIAKEGIRATSPGSESVITAQPTTVKLLSKEGAAPISLSSEQKINKPETRKVKVKVKKLIKNDSIENHWKRSFWLPLFIENKARFLAQIRKGYRLGAPRAKSNIDTDIGFSSIKDMLIYLPRAAQIVLLAPFPGQWFSEGSSPGSYFMHKIPIFEMPVVYFFLLFLPYAIWYWRKRIEIWIIFLFCIYMMLIYGLVICNVGTLYRMRYGYITILVALGIAGFIVFLEKFKSKNGDSV